TVRVTTPLDAEVIRSLRAGDMVLLSGSVYSARDAAHKRLVEALEAGQSLPFPVEGQVIYYVGPSPTKPGDVIGSAGPTTAGRVDSYTLPL
ncbi:fumarate hydratase C-terminal domain-containing protein, partial [Salmonella enterica]|uniref:fumarate hydratase C-terminal domain-containing protein n=1 Tax=Salmonella enterica TaxID=28901 RepID=UPI0039E86A2B